MDLHACLDDAVTIQPGQRVMIPTGLAIALPDAGYVALIFARSGLGVKHGIVPANCVGVIDSDYRGEVKVALQNHGDQPHTVHCGDRIAQMAVMPVLQPELEWTEELPDTQRGGRWVWLLRDAQGVYQFASFHTQRIRWHIALILALNPRRRGCWHRWG